MKITKQQAKKIGDKYKINFDIVPLNEFLNGLNIELEHENITNNDIKMTVKIALAHLEEDPRYYYYLEKQEKIRQLYWSSRHKPSIYL
jgi:hypothetical protein